jgi:hypothetical protein
MCLKGGSLRKKGKNAIEHKRWRMRRRKFRTFIVFCRHKRTDIDIKFPDFDYIRTESGGIEDFTKNLQSDELLTSRSNCGSESDSKTKGSQSKSDFVTQED